MRRRLANDALCAEHATIEARLEELYTLAAESDWSEVDRVWDEFERRVLEHVHFEDRVLLPRYAASGSRERLEAHRLSSQHVDLLRTIEELGLSLQTHHRLTLSALESLLKQLRHHAQREDELFHLWLIEQAPAAIVAKR